MKGRLAATAMLMTLATANASTSPASLPNNDHRDDPRRRQRTPLYGIYGIPYPHLHHVSRETLNRPRVGTTNSLLQREDRRARRKQHMQLRKRRGWR